MRCYAVALAAIFLIGAAALPQKTALRDISSYPSQRAAITRMVSRGIITPVKAGIFNPGGTVTRGDFAVMLQRLFNLRPAIRRLGYPDVSVRDPRYAAIAAAAPFMNRQVFCFGCELSSNFRPNATLTQGEATVFLMRILAARGKVRALTPAELRAVYGRTPDSKTWNPLMAPILAAGIQQQVATVAPRAALQPEVKLTRARAAVLLDNTQHLKPIVVPIVPRKVIKP
jgi:hypothetical protein